MRTIAFKEVLWTVANKLGLDPEQGNFLTNQAIPLGRYIDQWVRRAYGSRDWPELVATHKFTPVNHVVGWDAAAVDLPPAGPLGATTHLGRVFKVYIYNPANTGALFDTAFELREDGVYTGAEHGTNVWIRYIPRAPRFTAITWDADTTYDKDDIIYSDGTGECYQSHSSGNTGHDPSEVHRRSIYTAITQPFDSGTAGSPGQNKIMQCQYSSISPTPYVTGYTMVTVLVQELGLTVTTQSHTVLVGDTRDTIFADLRTLLAAALPGYAITQDTPNNILQLSNAGHFSMSVIVSTIGPAFYVPVIQIQGYIPAIPAVGITRQLTLIVPGSRQIIQDATYTIVMRDSHGLEHIVDYVATELDDANDILLGLSQALVDAQSSDPWLRGVYSAVDTVAGSLTLSFAEEVSVDTSFIRAGSQWWEFTQFPMVLAEPVIRGALADLYKEWGQTDKGAAEEGAVPSETQLIDAKFTTTPDPPLSGQQASLSRYKV